MKLNEQNMGVQTKKDRFLSYAGFAGQPASPHTCPTRVVGYAGRA